MTAPKARSRARTPVGSGGDNLVKPRLRLVHGAGGHHASTAGRKPVENNFRAGSNPTTKAVSANGGRIARGSAAPRSKANRASPAPVRGSLFESPARRSRLVTFASIAALALVVFSVVIGQVMLAQAAYSKASAERELEKARAEYERARLEEATASLPHEVEQRARGEMGLQDVSEEEPLALGPHEPFPSPPGAPVQQP